MKIENKEVTEDNYSDYSDPIRNNFEILDARNRIDWLFKQLDVDFELSQTKLLPLQLYRLQHSAYMVIRQKELLYFGLP